MSEPVLCGASSRYCEVKIKGGFLASAAKQTGSCFDQSGAVDPSRRAGSHKSHMHTVVPLYSAALGEHMYVVVPSLTLVEENQS
jgi:hypothetical protein